MLRSCRAVIEENCARDWQKCGKKNRKEKKYSAKGKDD
jgi:hypothetical protein